MPVKTIDASALAAVLFGEPEADRVVQSIGESSLAAPALLSFELANTCLSKIRRHPEQRDALLAALGLFERMDISLAAVDAAEVVKVAERTGLTAYDASYLWLAETAGAELVTLDKSLAAAFSFVRGR